MTKASKKVLAVVLAVWFVVGTAIAYLEKWSVMTRTLATPPRPSSNVRKSRATISIGWLVIMLSNGAQWGRWGALARMHLWHCAMYSAMSEVIPGQKNRSWHDATVRSWPRWPMSSCRSLHTTLRNCTGHSSCQHSSPSWFTFLR